VKKPPVPNDGYRRYAVGSFNSLNPEFLRISQNAAGNHATSVLGLMLEGCPTP
jgi:hypothetical protein